jgi:hypothetical protein
MESLKKKSNLKDNIEVAIMFPAKTKPQIAAWLLKSEGFKLIR